MKRDFYYVEINNIVDWFNEFRKEKINDLKIKDQWTILSNIQKLQPTVAAFNDFRQRLINGLNAEYFNDEKSDIVHVPKQDGRGNNIVDANGDLVMEEGRKIKDEYIEEYKEKVKKMNDELQNLMVEKTEYELKSLNLDDVIDGLPDDTKITLNDISMMSFSTES